MRSIPTDRKEVRVNDYTATNKSEDSSHKFHYGPSTLQKYKKTYPKQCTRYTHRQRMYEDPHRQTRVNTRTQKHASFARVFYKSVLLLRSTRALSGDRWLSAPTPCTPFLFLFFPSLSFSLSLSLPTFPNSRLPGRLPSLEKK